MQADLREHPADFCRAQGWGVGTRLAGEPDPDGRGALRIEITAVGRQRILAVDLDRPHLRETTIDFSCRDWQALPSC